MKRRKILMLTNYYLPCLNSGGPVITMQNIVRTFYKDADFYFCCLNHDMNSQTKYPFETNVFLDKGTYKIMYIEAFSKKIMNKILADDSFDVICCFGVYSIYTRFLIGSHIKFRGKLIVFPMGSFSPSAIKHKRLKKELFFFLYKRKLQSKKFFWSFTDRSEYCYAKAKLPKIKIEQSYFCPDLVVDCPLVTTSNNQDVVFISRIMDIKGLLEGIKYLNGISFRGNFDIYGPIEDDTYWETCKDELSKSKFKWNYLGFVNHEHIIETFSNYKLFLFLTKGENFGHVIYESLCAGCLPIIPEGKTIWDEWLVKIPKYSEIRKDINYFFQLEKNIQKGISIMCKEIASTYLKSQKGDYEKLFCLDSENN